MPPDPRVHVGVCALVHHPDEYDRFLFQHRIGTGGTARDGYGTWAFPGGWLDFGEGPQDAAAREVLEELGMSVAVDLDLAGWSQTLSDNGEFQIVTLFFHCYPISGEPRIMEPEKVDAVEWLTPAEASQRGLFHGTRAYLEDHYAHALQ